MEILSRTNLVQTNTPTSFRSINLVQIPKTAFKKPDDLEFVEATFKNIIDKTNLKNPQMPGLVRVIAMLMDLVSRRLKSVSFLESPGYTKIASKSSSAIKPLDENYHSFFVFTENNKDKLLKRCALNNVFKMAKKMKGNKPNSPQADKDITMNKLVSREIELLTAGEPVNKFVVGDLSELEDTLRKIAL